MTITHRLFPLLLTAFVLSGCKNDEEKQAAKQAEAAQEQLQKAQEQAQKAQAELQKAQEQLAASAAKLGNQGEALGAQGAALGMQAAAAGMQAAGAAMNNLAGVQGGAKTPLVDFRALKALLPESIGKLKRKSAKGEKSGAMGMGVSQAEGKYEDGDASMKIKISDVAGIGGIGLAALGMAMVEVDKETEDGYEKTSTINGNKSFEKYDGKDKRGEVKVIVGNRFVVEIDGDEVAMDDIKNAVSKLDLGKLDALAAAAK